MAEKVANREAKYSPNAVTRLNEVAVSGVKTTAALTIGGNYLAMVWESKLYGFLS
jgi:hypothetical protein